MEQKNAQVMYKHISFYVNSDVCVFMAVLQCKGRLGQDCNKLLPMHSNDKIDLSKTEVHTHRNHNNGLSELLHSSVMLI